jgi:hypothetical protein
VLESRQAGRREVPVLAIGVQATFVGKDKVGGDGSASDGWWIVGCGVKDFNVTQYDNDAYIKWGRELLAAEGIYYYSSGSFGSGFLSVGR